MDVGPYESNGSLVPDTFVPGSYFEFFIRRRRHVTMVIRASGIKTLNDPIAATIIKGLKPKISSILWLIQPQSVGSIASEW